MFQTYDEALRLPEAWYNLTHYNPWLHPDKLSLLERLQPCHQQYHIDPEAGIAFVSYALRLNALSLSGKKQIKIPVRMAGLPLSIAECGYHADTAQARTTMANYLRSQKGIWIILNAVDEFPLPMGATLPSCHLPVTWPTFDDYIFSLRSPYRRWISRGIEKGSNLKVRPLAPESFSMLHYNLYVDVFERSPYQLEKLRLAYFQQFPANLFEFCLDEKPVGFVQVTMTPSVLTFLFCGFDRTLVTSHHLYQNMLLWLLRMAIERKCSLVDFGQTTEETKSKLGAVMQPKDMYLSHKNPVIYSLMSPLARQLSYPGYQVIHHVFKEPTQ